MRRGLEAAGWGLALLVLFAGCGRGGALDGACVDDKGCGAGMRCVTGTGVCVRFTTPLGGVDGGARD